MRNNKFSLVLKCLVGWVGLAIGFTIVVIILGDSIISFGGKLLYIYFIAIPGIFVAGYYLFTKNREEFFDTVREEIKSRKILKNRFIIILVGILFGVSHNFMIDNKFVYYNINVIKYIFIGLVAAMGSYYLYLQILPQQDKRLRNTAMLKIFLKKRRIRMVMGGIFGFVFGPTILRIISRRAFLNPNLISHLIFGTIGAFLIKSGIVTKLLTDKEDKTYSRSSHPYESQDSESRTQQYKSGEQNSQSNSARRTSSQETQEKEFMTALLKLFAHVSRANESVKSVEVETVKNYVKKQFSLEEAQELMYMYKEILKKKYNIKNITQQIKENLEYNEILEILHMLFDIAGADSVYSKTELKAIHDVSRYMGIDEEDYDSIRSMFYQEENDLGQAYEILGVSPEASDSKVKQVYRELATKYHPDKVDNLGAEIKSTAEEKFKAINDAYQKIKEARNMD